MFRDKNMQLAIMRVRKQRYLLTVMMCTTRQNLTMFTENERFGFRVEFSSSTVLNKMASVGFVRLSWSLLLASVNTKYMVSVFNHQNMCRGRKSEAKTVGLSGQYLFFK